MNSHLLDTADSNVIQPSVALEPSVQTLNTCASIVKGFPILSVNKKSFLMSLIDFDNRLCPILTPDKMSHLIAAISRIGNNVIRMELAIGEPCLTENTAGCKSSAKMGQF